MGLTRGEEIRSWRDLLPIGRRRPAEPPPTHDEIEPDWDDNGRLLIALMGVLTDGAALATYVDDLDDPLVGTEFADRQHRRRLIQAWRAAAARANLAIEGKDPDAVSGP